MGELPWYVYRMAKEGLEWEMPWIPRVEPVEVKDRPEPPSYENPHEASLTDLAGLGFTVVKD